MRNIGGFTASPDVSSLKENARWMQGHFRINPGSYRTGSVARN
jgi:hypothetical protein